MPVEEGGKMNGQGGRKTCSREWASEKKRKYVKMDVAFRDAVKKGSSKRWVYEDTNWPLK